MISDGCVLCIARSDRLKFTVVDRAQRMTQRYQVFQYDSIPEVDRAWLIIDVQTSFVVRLNGHWAHMLSEHEARWLCAILNRLEVG